MNPFYEIAKNLRDRGVDQKTIYKAFSKIPKEMSDDSFAEGSISLEEYDQLLDTLDYITGYCSPHMRLFPEGMDWKELEDG